MTLLCTWHSAPQTAAAWGLRPRSLALLRVAEVWLVCALSSALACPNEAGFALYHCPGLAPFVSLQLERWICQLAAEGLRFTQGGRAQHCLMRLVFLLV